MRPERMNRAFRADARKRSQAVACRQMWVLAISFGGVFGFATAVTADITRATVEPILRLDLPGHTGEVRALAFSADSRRLVSGGRDKVAMVWTLGDPLEQPEPAGGGAEPPTRPTRNIARRRLREQVLRWQVARGTRGAIQAIAVSAAPAAQAAARETENEPGSVVAVAGSGAMGSTGEILLLDARDGSLVATLGGGDRIGHRQSVTSLSFTADGSWLVSQDLDGQAFAWQRADGWKPVQLNRREDERYGAAAAATLRRMPALRPAAALGTAAAVLPKLVSDPAAEVPVWRLEIVDLDKPGSRRPLSGEHLGVVAAVAASADGKRIASCDLTGLVRVWSVSRPVRPETEFETLPVAESLALSRDGGLLAAGVAGAGPQRPRLELWSIAESRRLTERPMPRPVRAVAFSPDGQRLAWTGGLAHEVWAAEVPNARAAAAEAAPWKSIRRLGGVGRPVTRVVFAKPEPPAEGTQNRNIIRRRREDAPPEVLAPARLAMATAPWPADNGKPPLSAAFHLRALANTPVGEEAAWSAAAGSPGDWSLEPAVAAVAGTESWQLLRGGKAAATIDLAVAWQGSAGSGRAISWISGPEPEEPWAIAIGTDRGIFVYRLAAAGSADLLRRYRGHEDGVVSLAVSADGRWLASGGRDGLVMLWPIAELATADAMFQRWGCAVGVQNNAAVVTAIDEAGTLAGKDVRLGDEITEISWTEASGEATTHREPAAIVAALPSVPWNAQVAFSVRPPEAAVAEEATTADDTEEGPESEPRVFQRLPAWENTATLFLAANREWAFWTPAGYYAASANGDTIFGWLVNRGLDRLPRFFRAQQFRRKLERPDVLSKLLTSGSLNAALRACEPAPPVNSAIVLPQQIALTPEVRIIDPKPGVAADGRSITVEAEITVPPGATLSRVAAYASGVIAAGDPQIVEDRPATADRAGRRVLSWQLRLPAEDRHLLQVFAAVEEGPTEVREVPIAAPARVAPVGRQPRLYLLACGVDRYAHSDKFSDLGLTDLVFAVDDARSVRESLARRTLELYDLTADSLMADTEVTRAGWSAAVDTLAAKVAGSVEPDDLLVVFLAGHGMINGGADRRYAFLCHDAILGEDEVGLPVAAAEGSLTWDDFRMLESFPCRKLALVDTCHSGGLGPAGRSTAVREFQENMIVVLAAASDDEPSQEADAWGHGAFTKVLLEALAGAADVGSSRTTRWQTAVAAADRRVLRGGRTGTDKVSATGQTGPDGVVSLDEVVDYVLREVPRLTQYGDDPDTAQHPTISPEALVPYVTVPLSLRTVED